MQKCQGFTSVVTIIDIMISVVQMDQDNRYRKHSIYRNRNLPKKLPKAYFLTVFHHSQQHLEGNKANSCNVCHV